MLAWCDFSSVQFSSVQCLNHIQLFATPGTTARQASKSIIISWSFPNRMSIESVMPSIELMMPSNYLILCRPLQSWPQSFPVSGYFQMSQLFTSGGQKYWSFSFNISPSSDRSPLGWTAWISLHSKGLSKSLLQHHGSKASILGRSAFFIVQLSHPYMTTGKTIALSRWTFVGKVMSLLFNMLSRLVVTLLPRSKCLLI